MKEARIVSLAFIESYEGNWSFRLIRPNPTGRWKIVLMEPEK